MPTGYTAPVQDGSCTKFNDFIWRCARAFGAQIMQRDDALEDGIRLTEEVSSYHQDQLDEAKRNLKNLLRMNKRRRRQFCEKRKDEILRGRITGIRKQGEEHRRYSAMLAKVATWVPPTPDHAGLKEFMVNQLAESIDFDCGSTYNEDAIEDALNADEFHFWNEAVETAKRHIEYHTKGLSEEVERINGRNQWRLDLIKSVGLPPKVKA